MDDKTVDDKKKEIKLLEAKLKEEFAYLQSVYDFSKKLSHTNGNLFLTKARDIPFRRSKFERTLERQQYSAMEVDEKYVPDFKRLASYDELADEIANVAKMLQDKIDEAKTKVPTSAEVNSSPNVKFPRLSLPTFDGKVDNWPTFHQLFEELVHKNAKVTPLEKVSYLVTHLEGPAKSICAGIPATAENYQLLYDTLVERYEDVRSLGSHYLDKILGFKSLSSNSEKELLSFLENFVEPALALKQLEIGSFFDFFMVSMALKKLDGETCRQFELQNRDVALPTFQSFHTFVREQAKIAARQKGGGSKSTPAQGAKKTHAFVAQSNDVSEENSEILTSPTTQCVVCSGQTHPLYRCAGFKKLTVPARFDVIKKNRLCFNCFSKRHPAFECSSQVTCRKCHKKHNTLIHFADNSDGQNAKEAESLGSTGTDASSSGTSSSATPAPVESESTSVVHSFLSSSPRETTVLLATARVAVQDRQGQRHSIRALLDTGSQSHFVTKQCCLRLGIPTKSSKVVVDCLSRKSTVSREQATFTFSSIIRPEVKFRITACVLDEIANNLPSVPVSTAGISHLRGLELADRELHQPGPIDLLVSASLWAEIVGVGRISGPAGSPVALETVFGWVVIGDVPVTPSTGTTHSFLAVSEPPLEVLMERFWSSDEVPEVNAMDPEDAVCEEHFVKNVTRLDNGQYNVALPFKISPNLLGDSYELAVKRFLSLERRLLRQTELHQQYAEVMTGHIKNGYMSPVSPEKLDKPSYFVPHHGVFKPSSSSTPLRVVWNMSAPTSSGYSLNDLMHVGPKLQRGIAEILLNYRLFEYALSADVRQMYLRIGVRPQDRRFQRLIWRSNPNEALGVYEMNCLPFGLSPAPYLAQRVVRDLAERERLRYPTSYEIVHRDLYMDDVATSVASEDEACNLQQELVKFFAAGNFTLAKWCSNSQQVLKQVPKELRLFGDQSLDVEGHTKILGLFWEPISDTFQFKIAHVEIVYTKRAILSNIARIFDPLGFLAPVVTTAKILMKSLWTLQIDWDDSLPDSIKTQWSKFMADLPALSSVAIPRHSGVFLDKTTELIGFADASESAYGAVVYVRSWSDAQKSADVRLLWAKSRVAPAKTKSIPRLELCAAVLLSKLLRLTVNLFAPRHKFDRIMAFTDSMVTLQWISSPPSRWQTYVSNRVSLIQENVDAPCWRHVRGDSNPADCLSRGLNGRSLIDHPMWFPGPPWLQENEENWPVACVSDLKFESAPNEKRVVKLNTNVPGEWILAPVVSRVSSLHRLHRITAWVLRAARLTTTRCAGLAAAEIDQAERLWLLHVQKGSFPTILDGLKSAPSQKKRNKDPLVNRLSLFLDDHGIIRVGGRLDRADLSYEQKHPILLPKDHPYVTLIIDQCHRDNLHTGPFLLMALLRMRFWILSARTLVRSRVHRCNVCFKSKPQPNTPKMAALPKFRLQQAKAFTHCGVDYAGPLTITMNRQRGSRTLKAYVCLFVCMSTKAIHLELASDLSTNCFLSAFHRFLARRGPVAVMYSDQGTNFIGARSVLKEVYDFAKSRPFNHAIEADLSSRRIEWKLNPPSAPHHGGLWEANVKSVKTHLNKVVGNQTLTYEEMTTALTQIEALLNSRPLYPLSSDPQAPVALTPAHFLTFGPTLDSFHAKDVSDILSNRLTHYERVNQIVQHYWKRWSQEYLHELQQRYKWQEEVPPLAVGNVVIIMKENTAPLHWPLAIIEQVFFGDDGKIRSAKVRTATGELIRPAVKLCVLPTQ